MTDLVACLSTGKGTWGQLMKVVESPSWENVFLVAPTFFAQKFQSMRKNVQVIPIDDNKELPELIKDIQAGLSGKLFGDVAVNFSSGSGKEHMAVLAALLKCGCGIRLVAHTDATGLQEL